VALAATASLYGRHVKRLLVVLALVGGPAIAHAEAPPESTLKLLSVGKAPTQALRRSPRRSLDWSSPDAISALPRQPRPPR